MRVPSDLAGRRVRCKACGAASVVPQAPGRPIPSLGSASVILDVSPVATPGLGRRIELHPDARTDSLMAEGTSAELLAELGRSDHVGWFELPGLAREVIAVGVALTITP